MDKIPTDELVKIVERWVKMGMLQNKNTVAHAERVIIVNRLVDWMSGLLLPTLVVTVQTFSQSGNITNEFCSTNPDLEAFS